MRCLISTLLGKIIMEKVVICMKWGKGYAPDYVNVLASAVKKHLKQPYRFVCLTDDDAGIDEGVECYPIPDMCLTASNASFGAWQKVSIFKEDLYGLTGRALFIDLDSMICDDLAPMFEVEGELVMIKEWKRPIDKLKLKPPVRGASGVLAFDLGTLPHLFDRFVKDRATLTQDIRNDQRYLWKFQKEIAFWPAEYVISFKRHLMRAPIVNWFLKPKMFPKGTRVLAFHGRPRPAEVIADGNEWWGDFWRCGRGPVMWFRNYWLANGGRDNLEEGLGPMRKSNKQPKENS